jgi:hypothetical protein
MAGRHVFISYSSRDVEVVKRMVRTLEQRGLACWMAPRDVPPGGNFGAAITDAIESAYAMVLVFSKNANTNANEIKKEVVLASQANLVVVPARIENLMPSDGAFRYELSTRQWVDLFDNWDQGIDKIVGHLTHLKPQAEGAPPEPPLPQPPARTNVMPSRRSLALYTAGTVAVIALAAGGFRLYTHFSEPAVSVAGTWQSAWGAVTFIQNGNVVTGSWQQGVQGTGQITNGTFDPAQRRLEFTYRQTWNNANGRAVFTLSPDGKTLAGQYEQVATASSPPRGEWVLRR